MHRSSKRAGLALAVGALVLLALGPGLAVAADGSVSIVEQDDRYKFQPAVVTVNVGDTVTWTNNSDAPHTVTDDGGSFDSGQFDENATFERTFDTVGQFAYHCVIHSYMTGTVNVLAAGLPTTDTRPAAAAGGAGQVPWLSILAAALGAVVIGGWLSVGRRRAEPAPQAVANKRRDS